MMRRGWLLAMAGVVVAVALIGGLALQVAAQEPPSPAPPVPVPVQPNACNVAKYDLNKDGRLTRADIDRWKRAVSSGGECELGADARLCPTGFDLNGDNQVTMDDYAALLDQYLSCLRSRRTDIG